MINLNISGRSDDQNKKSHTVWIHVIVAWMESCLLNYARSHIKKNTLKGYGTFNSIRAFHIKVQLDQNFTVQERQDRESMG